MYQVWLKSLDIRSRYRLETKIWACLGQIIPSKFDEICTLATPNQISTISMHILSLVFTGYHPETKIWAFFGQITSSPFYENCPQAIPNQISTISMHIPILVKIHRCLLKLSSGNEIRTDVRLTDGQTHGRPT